MGLIVDFPRVAPARARTASVTGAQILFFTGVRYERQPPKKRPAPRPRKKAAGGK
jgi:hypothetical protein